MKTPLLALFGLCLLTTVHAQAPAQAAAPLRTPEQLDELLGPIALYTDAEIAVILPAATLPSEVVLAARYLQANGDPAQIESQSWDPSVKSLTHFPDALKWMDENLEWTTEIGQAFLDQQADVMNSIQQLRAKAQAKGNLVDTPQQNVVMDNSDIRIVPAQPDTIYEPLYDPSVIYNEAPSADLSPYLLFGAGCAVGAWLDYDFDWYHHRFYRGDWGRGWDYGRGGRGYGDGQPYINNHLSNARQWQPDANRMRREGRREGGSRSLGGGIARGGAPSVRSKTDPSGNRGHSSVAGHSNVPHPAARSGAPVHNGVGRSGGPALRSQSGVTHGAPNAPHGAVSGIQRGSTAREYSQRGQGSRQPNVSHVNRSVAPAEHRSSPAAVQHVQRSTPHASPVAPRAQSHSSPALHGMNNGAAAAVHSQRGAQSRSAPAQHNAAPSGGGGKKK